jgi:hypothetical protein
MVKAAVAILVCWKVSLSVPTHEPSVPRTGHTTLILTRPPRLMTTSRLLAKAPANFETAGLTVNGSHPAVAAP